MLDFRFRSLLKKRGIPAVTFALIVAGVVPMAVSAAPSAPSKNPIDRHDVEQFFYKKGYSEGRAAGMREGYAKAKKDFLSRLRRYASRIKAMEAGKYLSHKHKITAPRIYQKKGRGGKIEVIVKGCGIARELTPSDILKLPPYDGSSYTQRRSYSVSSAAPKVSNSVFLPGVDKRVNRPKLSSSVTKATYKYFPDTQFYRNVFRQAGIPFAIVAGSKIKVRFDSEKDAASFCRRYGLTPGKDVI